MCATTIRPDERNVLEETTDDFLKSDQRVYLEEQQYRRLMNVLAYFRDDEVKQFGDRVTQKKFKKYFESKLNVMLIEQRLLDPSFFFCALYIARLLSDTLTKEPVSWYAVDYHEKRLNGEDASVLKDGGDMCFLMSSVFPEHARRKLVDIPYYKKMGRMFYFGLYSSAHVEIGYHMGKRFDIMSNITHQCIESIQ